MRYLCLSWIFVFLYFLPEKGNAQISPGELSAAHAELEGVFNCTKCHELGKRVTNEKCLECHTEINARIQQSKGYHAAQQVRKKNCFDCHSEHHGRKFEMIRFDKKSFNHDWTGYKLTGAHKATDCRDCHKPDHIQDTKVKKDKKTFLGLGRECVFCHNDVHQNTLSRDCANCHTTQSFTNAANFNHSKTDFALFGKHAQVACVECHKKETRNGQDFQHFADVPFSNCTSCHTDAHHANLGTECKACHTERGWNTFIGRGRFDHSATPFPLKGQHRKVDCRECHDMGLRAHTIFQDRLGVRTDQCITCHDDVHDGKFGSNCAECHTEQRFRGSDTWKNFNHNRTDFPLEGKHELDCRECHEENMVAPLSHTSCTSCHTDFHEGQFAKNGESPDCSQCHTVEGFSESSFGFDQHENTGFPLQGAHIATPCFECHLNEAGNWQFIELGTRCVDCHTDVHQGEIAERFYPEQDCSRCHVPESWIQNKFDHNQTGFKLEGAHFRQPCSACHLRDDEDHYGKFKNLEEHCISCHDNVHGAQFIDPDNKIDCNKCHGFEDWSAANFNHNLTKFKLEGKHAEIECSACHKPSMENGQAVVLYKIEQFECIDCHH